MQRYQQNDIFSIQGSDYLSLNIYIDTIHYNVLVNEWKIKTIKVGKWHLSVVIPLLCNVNLFIWFICHRKATTNMVCHYMSFEM